MKRLLTLLLCLSFLQGNSQGKTPEEMINLGESYFLSTVDVYNESYDNTSTSNQPVYYRAYKLLGLLSAFQVTSDFKYLERIINYCYQDIQNSVNTGHYEGTTFYNGDGFYDYLNTEDQAMPLWDSHGMWPVFTTLVMMKNNPWILVENVPTNNYGRSGTYQDDLDYLTEWYHTNIWVKWRTRKGPTSMYARSQTHINSHWVRIVEDLKILKPNYTYDDVTRFYLYDMNELRESYSAGMLTGMIKDNPLNANALTYDRHMDDPDGDRNPSSSGTEDVNHGNADVSTFVKLEEMGILTYEEALIDKWVNTIYVFYPNFGRDLTYELLDGSGSNSDLKVDLTNGWLMLGRYNLALQIDLENSDTYGSGIWGSGGRTDAHWWVLALNKAMLNGDDIIELYATSTKPISTSGEEALIGVF
ncbi:MAG: hypothetical protein CMC35_02890 [Flavobacteriaceae bacterium]|nr:hypothetical protein [Flavobacteriaceae bacterium]|tara:strand:- start:1092 stop:2339 length:1248 start_codon:yes stop_codon:yes gene_type:complete